ncbi:FecR family protein [Sphingobacterium sp. SGG-5]|uniref:FecR family protein n=1 Tax=Sphingobacterium sp. SGG-5 TaxID=2710881 RepID=UPI0013E9DD55|nr:FecR family protein [Sphingobacterium sp. SGG-5]NGM62644.1 FecR family protein [Sphingobacterium sp. SGG-5]
MDKVRLKYLLEKHIADTISPVELDELFALLETIDTDIQEEVLTDILDKKPQIHVLPEVRRQAVYDEIRKNVQRQPISFKKYISIAAVLVVGMSSLLWLWKKSELTEPNGVDFAQEATYKADDIYIIPDSVPFVQLPNGEIQLLEESQSNVLAETGVKIRVGENGERIYEVQQIADGRMSQAEDMVFTTPKGQSSKVLLIDGTEVWLNSGSSLTYPRSFSGKERRVKLTGEGYFEVAHNKEKPFYVETEKGPLIRVLGTSFNVSAYKGENKTTTTLITGLVRLTGDHHNLLLKPSEQVIASHNDRIFHKKQVNVNDFISWKDGYFSFNGQSVPEILAEVRRWYNIQQIDYTYMPEERFTGTFKRTKSLRSLLLKLEKISNVKFEIKERRIVVTK